MARPDHRHDEIDWLDTSLLAQGASIFTALSGTANVIMQLSRPEIGYAVKDSVVTEGNLFTNPRRRRRTRTSSARDRGHSPRSGT